MEFTRLDSAAHSFITKAMNQEMVDDVRNYVLHAAMTDVIRSLLIVTDEKALPKSTVGV